MTRNILSVFFSQNMNTLLKRRIAMYASAAIYIHLSSKGIAKPANERRNKQLRTNSTPNKSFVECTALLTDEEFKCAFRMTRETFKKLVAFMKPTIEGRTQKGKLRSKMRVPVDLRLGITIRYLAGAQTSDLIGWFKLKRTTLLRIMFDTVQALISKLRLPGLPRDIRGLHQSSMNFKCSRRLPNPLNGCVGALDGITIRIKRPRGEHDQRSYFNRKGVFAIPVQAVCDSSYKFLCLSAKCVGSTHDSLAHAVSKLGQFLDQKGLNGEFWIDRDEAYTCTESLITPVSKSEAGEDEDAFNYYLSQMRIHIEQAFGMLVSKWAILQSPLGYSIQRCTRIIACTICLHNWCLENQDGEQPGIQEGLQLDVYRDTVLWHRKIRHDLTARTPAVDCMIDKAGRSRVGKVVSRKRQLLVEVIRQKGIRRPVVRR